MKKVFISGAEAVINALQDNKVLFLDDRNSNLYAKFWLYKGFICQTLENYPTHKISTSMIVLPEYKYYYFE